MNPRGRTEPKVSRGSADTKLELATLKPEVLSPDEIKVCLHLINSGGALTIKLSAASLQAADMVCVVRSAGKIIGVGVVKPPRPSHALKVAELAEFKFDKAMLEVGYISRAPAYKGKRLSEKILTALFSCYPNTPLFATTSHPTIKSTFELLGVTQKGREWIGPRRNRLSLWIRGV
jgi:hypothetical protein